MQAIEPIMIELSKLDKNIQEFLKNINYDNVKDFVDSQSESIEKNVADRLLIQISNLQVKTRHQLVNSANLLVKSKKFIDYNVNVLSQTVSTNLYGPPGAESESPRRRRIFSGAISYHQTLHRSQDACSLQGHLPYKP